MTWSYSRLAAFSDCPYKWFLTYLYRDERGKPLPRQSSFFAEFGSYVHLILQMHLNGILARRNLPTFYIRHYADNVRSQPPSAAISQNYFSQGLDYFESISFPKREILDVEKNVRFTFAGKPWTGFIDLVSRDENGLLIVTDHKSRTLKPRSGRSKPTKTDQELDDYLRQLYVYAAPVRNLYGRLPDMLEFNCFRSGIMIREPFNPDRFKEVEQWAAEQIETITTNDVWSAEPDFWRCNYLCDVCRHCEMKALR